MMMQGHQWERSMEKHVAEPYCLFKFLLPKFFTMQTWVYWTLCAHQLYCLQGTLTSSPVASALTSHLTYMCLNCESLLEHDNLYTFISPVIPELWLCLHFSVLSEGRPFPWDLQFLLGSKFNRTRATLWNFNLAHCGFGYSYKTHLWKPWPGLSLLGKLHFWIHTWILLSQFSWWEVENWK